MEKSLKTHSIKECTRTLVRCAKKARQTWFFRNQLSSEGRCSLAAFQSVHLYHRRYVCSILCLNWDPNPDRTCPVLFIRIIRSYISRYRISRTTAANFTRICIYVSFSYNEASPSGSRTWYGIFSSFPAMIDCLVCLIVQYTTCLVSLLIFHIIWMCVYFSLTSKTLNTYMHSFEL